LAACQYFGKLVKFFYFAPIIRCGKKLKTPIALETDWRSQFLAGILGV
jgi:hypothetical protein